MKELTDNLASGRLNGIDKLLSECWDQFDGSRDGGMEGYKLLGRMEKVRWAPPVLSFTIERHGGTVLGSTRAEVQHWQVNVDAKTATLVRSSRRQVRPTAKRSDIKTVALEIVCSIVEGTDDARIKRLADGSVRIVAAAVYPSGSACKQTIEGRRRRLTEYVADELRRLGWRKTKAGWRESLNGVMSDGN